MAIRAIRVTNTLSGRKEVLETLQPGRLTLYSCGPTVYNLIHIGNLRAAMVADLFFRFFRRVGYEVTFVRNYTDVDDKIIARARQEGLSSEEVARKYIAEVERDYAVAGLLEPSHKTTVTTHIAEIITMIEKILEKGQAYVVEGEVFFSVRDFPGYGKLSHRNIDELEAGARVEVNEKKRNPLDFSLWKPAKVGEPSWDSPWGKGRPGWHIECSAMASKWLGDQIDVHHGGEDLVFPHHENEVAQSESACGRAPFVRFWLHSAFLTLSKEKMSKSLGNVFLARDFLTQYSGEIARYLLLSVHYRTILDFGDEAIENALIGLQRIYEAKLKAKEISGLHRAVPDLRAEALWGEFVADCEKTREKMLEAMANDFGTPEVLSSVFQLVRELNRISSEPLAQATPAAVLGAQAFIALLEQDLGDLMGIGRLDPEKALADLSRVRRERSGEKIAPAAIEALIEERRQARVQRNFQRADEIRKELLEKGVEIKDGPQGTSWEYR
ncbi:MAG: cysteine--tRNA ligase [Pseudomonadota bacterium]|jgi:cysteinyl-tRNA synthetase